MRILKGKLHRKYQKWESEVEKIKNDQILKVSQHLAGNPKCKIALVPAHFCTEVSELLVETAEDLPDVFC